MTSLLRDSFGDTVPAFRYGITHKKAYSSLSVQIDNPVSEKTRLVLVWASTDCHIAIGVNPEATTGSKPITAKVDTPIVVRPGDKVAVISQFQDGDIYVTELL